MTNAALNAQFHPPLARDAQGNLVSVPDGTVSWRICRKTSGRPREILGHDKQPIRFPLDMTCDQLVEMCGRDVYRVYALDGVGELLDHVATLDLNGDASELRNASGTELAVLGRPASLASTDLRFALEAMTQMMRTNAEALRTVTTEVRSKNIIYEKHLKPRFGDMPLDEITTSEVAQFRADLVGSKLSEKRINNILAVLSKPLKYAVDCELITKAPRIGMFKVERPEIVAWDFEQYARLLAAAKTDGEDWYAAVCLCGEAGLRIGEVKALRWREDVDMIAKTITINLQTRNGQTTTPKGRTRRTVPMTTTLYDALKRMSAIREGLVVRNLDGSAKGDGQSDWVLARICRRAGLPVRYWHSFGTHAALFGVNPWRLQTWMGHKRIDETMLYVHVAEAHARELPDPIREAAQSETDPDRRIVAMLGARGKTVAKTLSTENKTSGISAA